MNTSPSTKKYIIGGIVLLVVVAAYFMFFRNPADSGSSSGSFDTQSSQSQVGGVELSLLNQISALHIDTTLFTRASFISLVDFSVAIPEQDVGRPNPFAPVPGVTVTTKP